MAKEERDPWKFTTAKFQGKVRSALARRIASGEDVIEAAATIAAICYCEGLAKGRNENLSLKDPPAVGRP